jgi:phospholipid/cholesterol/gamma-HCH transport system ATP-binding protein
MATSTNGENRPSAEPHIIVRNLTMAYGSFVLMRDLNFVVKRGDIFIIMGGSGCGKSTLLRHLIGLKEPATGEIIYGDINFTRAEPEQSSMDRARAVVAIRRSGLRTRELRTYTRVFCGTSWRMRQT